MQHVTETSPTLPAGRVEVLPRAIASVAARAALETEGVAGLAPAPGPPPGPLRRDDPRRSVEIQLHGAGLVLEVYILVAYGAPIAAVAEAVQERVRAALHRALGQPPAAVRVRVQGLR